MNYLLIIDLAVTLFFLIFVGYVLWAVTDAVRLKNKITTSDKVFFAMILVSTASILFSLITMKFVLTHVNANIEEEYWGQIAINTLIVGGTTFVATLLITGIYELCKWIKSKAVK